MSCSTKSTESDEVETDEASDPSIAHQILRLTFFRGLQSEVDVLQGVAKHRVAIDDGLAQDERVPERMPGRLPKLNQWPSDTVRVHSRTHQSAKREDLATRDLWFTGVFDQCQNGVAVPKPASRIDIISGGVVRVALNLTDFPAVPPVMSQVRTGRWPPIGATETGRHRKGQRLDSLSGEKARRRPSHEECGNLGRIIRFINDLLQNVSGHDRNSQIKRKQ